MRRTIIERLEIADELNILIDRREFLRVNGSSQHMTAELQMILC